MQRLSLSLGSTFVGTLGRAVRLAALLAALLALLAQSGCGSDKIADGVVDGARIFAEACSRCHGSTGTPPPNMAAQYGVPDLRRPEFHRDNDVQKIRERIAQGSNRKGMPAFATALTAEQLDAVVAHVQGFAR